MNELLDRRNRKDVRLAEEARLAKSAAEPETPPDLSEAPVVTEPGSDPMDRYEFAGFPIVVENEEGSIRLWGEDPDTGKAQGSLMHYDYGYIDGAIGADGDDVDVYIGPEPNPEWVYIVHQHEPESGEYDEDKVMLGWPDAESAKRAYLEQYDNPNFFGAMSQMSLEEFRKKLGSRETLKITNAKSHQTELKRGIEVEHEHQDTIEWFRAHPEASVKDVAEKIALDHLDEIKDYYTRLDAMERTAKGESEVEKAVTLDNLNLGTISGLDDEDLKQVANEIAELWASLYGSALDSQHQAVSEIRLALSPDEIQALRERRKPTVYNDEPLSPAKVYVVTHEGKAYGILSMTSPKELSIEEFMKQDSENRWPNASRLFSHDVLSFLDFGEPIDPDRVEYKAITKMNRDEVVRLARTIVAEARRRKLDVGFPADLIHNAEMVTKQGVGEAHPQQDLYMPPVDPSPTEAVSYPHKPKEYASNNEKIPGVFDPVDGPKAHEWGGSSPAQQEWDSGDYSHYGDGDWGGWYEFSISGGARFVRKQLPAIPANAGVGTAPNAGESPIRSDDLATAGKKNPIIAYWKTPLTKAVVRPTVRMLLEARAHEALVNTADHLQSLGLIDGDERESLAKLFDTQVERFGGEMPYDLGSKSLEEAAGVETFDVPPPTAKDSSTSHPEARPLPDIIMEMPRSAPPGPAAQSPQWGHTPHPVEVTNKEAEFVVGEPPPISEKARDEDESSGETSQDTRQGHFESAADEYMVEQKGEERYPFVLQHHFRGIWTSKERAELKAGLQEVKDLTKKDEAEADKLLAKLWSSYKPVVLTTTLEKLERALATASEQGGEVSTVAEKNLDASIPRAIDLQRLSGNIVNRGNVHTDLRIKSPAGDWLIGWTMDTPGIALQTVDGKLLRVMRSKVVEHREEDKILTQKKGKMGVGALYVVSPGKSVFRLEPGEVGATKRSGGEIRFVDRGEVIFGVQKPEYHEMFLFFEKNQSLSGRWEAKAIERKDGESYWLIDKPKDQAPYATSHDELAEARKSKVIWNSSALAALKAMSYRDLPAETVEKVIEIHKSATEERTVFGIVMEPEVVDAHGEVVSAEEIKNAAYTYMEFYQQKGFQHGRNPKYPSLPDGLRLLESYVVDPEFFPEGFNVGSRHIKPGSWLMRMRVDHDGLWDDIKNGFITGFSIGGFARTVKEDKAS